MTKHRKMDNSPLMRLPPELRNRIYDLVVIESQPITISIRKRRFGTPMRPPALLHNCRQLRAEASPVYYSSNIFIAEEGQRSTLGPLETWLRMIGEEARGLVHRIHFNVYFLSPSLKDAKHESRCCEELMAMNSVVVPEGSIYLPYFVRDDEWPWGKGEELWACSR